MFCYFKIFLLATFSSSKNGVLELVGDSGGDRECLEFVSDKAYLTETPGFLTVEHELPPLCWHKNWRNLKQFHLDDYK